MLGSPTKSKPTGLFVQHYGRGRMSLVAESRGRSCFRSEEIRAGLRDTSGGLRQPESEEIKQQYQPSKKNDL